MTRFKLWARPAKIVILAASYFCAGKLSLLLASVHPSAAPVWPPTGMALAALLLWGYGVWPGIFLGAFFTNLTTFGSTATSLVIAAGNTLEALTGAYLVNGLAGGCRTFERPQSVFKFSILAGGVAPVVSATFGVTSLAFWGFADWSNYSAIWMTWWLGDMSGALVAAPFLVLWGRGSWSQENRKKWIEGAGLLGILVLVGFAVFPGWLKFTDSRYPLAFLSLPLLAWAAMRFGIRETATVALLLSGIALWRTLRGAGPFLSEEINQSLLLLQTFIGITTVTALMLASAVSERERTQTALGESEKRYRSLIENSTDGVALFSAEAALLYASPSIERMLGYPAKTLEGRNGFELIHPDERESVRRRFLVLTKEPEKAVRAEARVRHQNGEWRWMEWVGSNLLSETAVGAIVINFRDITERKRAEEKFRTAVESCPSGIVMVNREGKIVLVNSHTETLFGYRREELAGQSIERLVPERFREGHPALRSGFFANPQTRVVGGGRDLFGRHKDGREIPVEIGLNPLRTEEGLFVLATIVDITERKRLEGELRDANEKLSGWVRELERRNQEVFLLNEMGDLLQSCLSFDEACQVISRTAPHLFPEEPGALFIFEPHRRILDAVALWGEPLLGEKSFGPDDCWALRRGRMHRVENAAKELVCPHLSQPLWKGCLCIPLVAQSETLGLLHLQSGPDVKPSEKESVSYWNENKVRLARIAAEHIALNLAGLKLRATLSEHSIRDSLTGLFNRRYLEESLGRELFRAARERLPLGTLMLDLDRFKQFNDTFGHSAGDAVLKALGDFLQKRTRGGDIACRYGGEEFTLILPGASLEMSRQRADKLRQEIQKLKVPYGHHVTVSIGVAVFPEHGLNKEALLKSADWALYQAKKEGGNQIAIAPLPTVSQPKVR